MKLFVVLLIGIIGIASAYNATLKSQAGEVVVFIHDKTFLGNVELTVAPAKNTPAHFLIPIPVHASSADILVRLNNSQVKVEVTCNGQTIGKASHMASTFACGGDFGELGLRVAVPVSQVHFKKESFTLQVQPSTPAIGCSPCEPCLYRCAPCNNDTNASPMIGTHRSSPFLIGLAIGGICAISMAVGWFAALFCVKRRLNAMQQAHYQNWRPDAQLQFPSAQQSQTVHHQQAPVMHMQVPLMKTDL